MTAAMMRNDNKYITKVVNSAFKHVKSEVNIRSLNGKSFEISGHTLRKVNDVFERSGLCYQRFYNHFLEKVEYSFCSEPVVYLLADYKNYLDPSSCFLSRLIIKKEVNKNFWELRG